MRQKKSSGASQSWFLWVAPFFLPAFFFVSLLFSALSPLPFFLVTLKNKLWISVLALVTNAIFVYQLTASIWYVAVSVWIWASIGILFPWFIRRYKKVPFAFALSYSIAVAALIAGIFMIAQSRSISIIDLVRNEVSLAVDRASMVPDENPVKIMLKDMGKTELVKQSMTELPALILVGLILGYWFNLLLAFRALPGFLSRIFWSSYRTPEWLIWPTLLCAALYVFTEHAPHYFGLNAIKVFFMFYGFQGLSIVAHFLNKNKVTGLMRAVIFSGLIFFASPFVLAVGFFDLWFDFRRKFGQT